MRDEPSAIELIRAVAIFLRERAAPSLSGHVAFEARVAANALDTVLRELEIGPSSDQSERERLSALLGVLASGNLLEDNETLCAAIAAGRLGVDDAALMQHLWRTTLEKLAIDQPSYSGYRAAQSMPLSDPS